MKKERNVGLDLLRIVSMLMIVTSHVLFLSGTLKDSNVFSSQYYVVQIISAFTYCFTNCFVMISGYFLVDKKFSAIRIIKLYATLMFFSIIPAVILFFMGKIDTSVDNICKIFLPVSSIHYWYITAYLGLCLVFPFINIMINHMNRKTHKYVIIFSSIMFVFIPGELIGFSDPFYVDKGYNWIWFVFIYFIASYIKKYDVVVKKKISGLIFICSALLTALSRFVIAYISNMFIGKVVGSGFLYRYNSITVLVGTISLFMFFKELRIDNKIAKRAIISIAPLMLGVYLLHMNIGIKEVLRNYLTELFEQSSNILYLQVICSVLVIFVVGIIIEKIRQLIFKYSLIDKATMIIGMKIDSKIGDLTDE